MGASGTDGALELLDEVIEVASTAGRDDLVDRLRVARVRAQRPTTVVCVVGEFKQGKSSLVNALLGRDLCPVDDDLATSALTVVHHAAELEVLIRRTVGGEPVAESIDPEDLREHVTEAGNPDNQRAIERVDIGLPHPLLERGLVLVDTPGMGGLGAGHTAATLAFLPYADAVIVTTDASQELTATELDFLVRARDTCPTVLLGVTKIDLYPRWRDIAAFDAGHLDRAGLAIDAVHVSAQLRREARQRGDDTLDEESGIPRLEGVLRDQVLDRSGDLAQDAARREAARTVEQLRTSASAELEALRDPSDLADQTARLQDAVEHLERVRDAGSRWSTVLSDAVTDLSGRVTHDLRARVRAISRDTDERLGELKAREDLERLVRDVQADAATAVADSFADVERAAADLREELASMLGEEVATIPAVSVGARIDPESLWHELRRDQRGRMEGLREGLVVLRGAQSGVYMLGMMSRMLPVAAASILGAGPLLLGAGVVMGGTQFLGQRKRRVEQERQQVRAAVRQFLDDVQFETGPALADAVRGVQRHLRDEVSEQISVLQQTYRESVERTRAALAATKEERTARLAQVEAELERLEALARRSETST